MTLEREGTWQVYVNDGDRGRYYNFNVGVADALFRQYGTEIIKAAMQQAADMIAKQYVKEHGQEIIAQLDQRAIATTTVANAGHRVADSLYSRPYSPF